MIIFENINSMEIAMKNSSATSPAGLGHILRDARRTKGVSQTKAGKSVGIDQPTLSKIERGAANARLDTLFRLLAALDLEILVRERHKSSDTTSGDSW